MRSPWSRIRIGAVFLVAVFTTSVVGYRVFGGYDWIGAFWMVVVTISTTGHTERSSFGPGMQLYTIGVIIFGMTAAFYTFSGFFQLVLEGELDCFLGSRRMTRDIAQLSDHIIVCGYGRMGAHLVQDLRSAGLPLVVIDDDSSAVEEASAEGLLCLQGDATQEEMLEAMRIRHAKTLVTSLPSDADSVFITLTARELNPSLQIIARAEQLSTEKKLRQAGANRIVMPTLVGAKQMVRLITRPGTANLIDLVTEPSFEGVELDEVVVADGSPVAGKKLCQVKLLQTLDLLVVAIGRKEIDLVFNPQGDEVLDVGDTIILMGHPKEIHHFRQAVGDAT